MSKNFKKKKCIWLTNDISIYNLLNKNGYNCHISHSLIGIFYGFRAKWHIFNYSPQDTSIYSSIGAFHLNLWTGVQIKKLKKFKHKKNNLFKNYLIKIIYNKKYFLYPNLKYCKNIQDHYGNNYYNFFQGNFPKQIIFEKKNYNLIFNSEKQIINKILRYNGKIIGYFPTWRDNGSEFYKLYKNKSFLYKLNNYLKATNSVIILKQHSTSHEKNFKILNKIQLSQFIFLDYNFDLNLILNKCDLIISDYSGIIFDFLYFDKQIILLLDDFKKYKKNPGLNFNYDNFNVGYKVYNFEDLYKYLKKFLNSNLLDKHKTSRRVYKADFYKNNNSYMNNIITKFNIH